MKGYLLKGVSWMSRAGRNVNVWGLQRNGVIQKEEDVGEEFRAFSSLAS